MARGSTPAWCSIHTAVHATNQIHRGNSIHHMSRARRSPTSWSFKNKAKKICETQRKMFDLLKMLLEDRKSSSPRFCGPQWVRAVCLTWATLRWCRALLYLKPTHRRVRGPPSCVEHDSNGLFPRCLNNRFQKSAAPMSFGLDLADHLPVKRIAAHLD